MKSVNRQRDLRFHANHSFLQNNHRQIASQRTDLRPQLYTIMHAETNNQSLFPWRNKGYSYLKLSYDLRGWNTFLLDLRCPRKRNAVLLCVECANFLCVFFPHWATLLAFKSTLTVVSNVLSPACLPMPAITQKPIAPLRTELEREHTQRRQRKASEIGAQAQSMSSSSSTAQRAQSVPNEIEDTVKIEL